MTKRIISVIIAAMIIVVALCGCSSPFTSGNAIKGQVEYLRYSVPTNAVLDDKSTEDSKYYNVSIGNGTEEYMLIISACEPFIEEDENGIKTLNHFLIMGKENYENTTFEDIYEFEGITIDKGYKRISDGVGENNDKKVIEISFVKSKIIYQIIYSVKREFFDQSVWDNFCSQIKYVDH